MYRTILDESKVNFEFLKDIYGDEWSLENPWFMAKCVISRINNYIKSEEYENDTEDLIITEIYLLIQATKFESNRDAYFRDYIAIMFGKGSNITNKFSEYMQFEGRMHYYGSLDDELDERDCFGRYEGVKIYG